MTSSTSIVVGSKSVCQFSFQIQINLSIQVPNTLDNIPLAVREECLAYFQRELPNEIPPNFSGEFSIADRKKYLGFLSATRNNLKLWATRTITNLVDFIDLLGNGYSYRGGIKIGGNSKKDIQNSQVLSLDFDEGQYTGATERDEFFQSYACLWYKTPSYSSGCQKHRVVFILDRPVTPTEYALLYQWWMLERYPHADTTKDAGRLFYGAKQKSDVYTISETNLLPVDVFLKLASEAKQYSEQQYEQENESVITNLVTESKTSKAEAPRGDFTQAILEHLYEHLFLGLYQGNPGKLYSYHDLSQTWKKRDPEEGEIIRLAGSNPFSPSDTNKTSFMVIYVEGKLPRFWDKSGNLDRILMREKGAESSHGSYLDYYFHVRKTKFNDFQDIEYQSNGGFPKGFFIKLVHHICSTFNIPKFKFSATTWNSALYQTLESFTDKLFHQGWMKNDKEFLYCVWSESKRCYESVHIEKFVLYNFIPKLETDHENLYDLYTTWWREKGKKTAPKMSNVVQTFFKEQFRSFLEFRPSVPRSKIPMQNGVFNLETRQLESYDSTKYISFMEPLPHRYYKVDDYHPVIQNLTTYFTNWMNSPLKGELLLAYLILCVQREAYKLRHMVVLMGTSTRGKSTYGSLVCAIVDGNEDETKNPREISNSVKLTAPTFLGHNAHNDAMIEDAFVVYLDEMNNIDPNNCDVEKLKLFVAEATDRKIKINPKFEKPRTIRTYAGFIGASEDILKVRTSDGLDNRFIYVTVDKSTNMTLKKEIENLQQNTEIIHNWCLTQDTNYWSQRFLELSKNPIFKDALIEKKRESEPLVYFLEEFFEFTDDPQDTVGASTIWDMFRDYRDREKMNRDYSSQTAFGIALKKILTEGKYGFNWQGDKVKKKKIEYTHMKIVTSNDETSDF